jgi:hypothetical protein
MSATQDLRNTFGYGEKASLPVTASTTIYKGSMVSLVNGNAKALADGEKFVGHCIDQVVNSGAAGAKNVDVIRGENGKYKMEVALPLVNSLLVGAFVYAIDDNTYTLAPMATPVGKVVQYVASGIALVEFDVNLCRENMGGQLGLFEAFRKGIVCAADAKMGLPFIHTVVDGDSDAAHYIKNLSAERGKAYHNGVLIHTNDKAGDGSSIQMSGAPFYLDSASKPVVFGARIMLADATVPALFMGLAVVDTSLSTAVSDDISIRKAAASADVKLYVEKGNAETVSGAAEVVAVDATAVTLGFLYDGTKVYPAVNGVFGTGLAVTNLPNTARLTPSLEFLNGGAATKDLTVYFLDTYQIV